MSASGVPQETGNDRIGGALLAGSIGAVSGLSGLGERLRKADVPQSTPFRTLVRQVVAPETRRCRWPRHPRPITGAVTSCYSRGRRKISDTRRQLRKHLHLRPSRGLKHDSAAMGDLDEKGRVLELARPLA